MNRFGRQHHHSSVYKSFLAWKLELQILLKRNKRCFLYLVVNLTPKLNSPHKLLPIIISLRILRAEAMNPTQIVLRDVVETSPFFESLGGNFWKKTRHGEALRGQTCVVGRDFCALALKHSKGLRQFCFFGNNVQVVEKNTFANS